MRTITQLGLIAILTLSAPPVVAACEDSGVRHGDAVAAADREPPSPAATRPEPVEAEPLPGLSAEEAARAAWSYVDRNWVDRTGLVGATEHYAMITSWDMGSILAALYSARGLGLIDAAEYDRRMSRLLATLAEVDLYEGVAFNKAYDSRTGRMVDRADRPSSQGYGWSVLDVGRILSWLKIVERGTPQHAEAARRVVGRLDFGRLVEDGYLIGGNLERGRTVTYAEGRVGYEQYAAEAFARWGHPAPRSARLAENTRPVSVLGHELYADTRGRDRLTSEPFVLLGLEMGWSDEVRRLATSLLGVQRARHEETGTLTIASEDAMTEPPHYFYYYAIYQDGQTFVVDAQGARGPLTGPRWVSAKAALGWHALLPDDYTARAVEAIVPAMEPGAGWYSGVYESDGRRAGSLNINTAGVILQALLFRESGLPLLVD
jgi:hypothetical protein